MNSHISTLFRNSDKDEIILWQDTKYDGFSVLRDYPVDCGFVPAINKKEDTDTKILIKIGFNNEQKGKTNLYVTASKYSRYAERHFGYDFNDELSPTKESLDASRKSPNPVDLEENERYTINIEDGTIFDAENNKNVTVNEIIDEIYKKHLATISGLKATILKAKLKTKNVIWHFLFEKIEKIIKGFEWLNEHFFGKTLIKNSLGSILGPFDYKNLTSTYPDVIPFFNSTLKISKINIIWVALSLLTMWLTIPCLKDMSETITLSLLILLVCIFDVIIPRVILSTINGLVWVRRKLGEASFFYKTKF